MKVVVDTNVLISAFVFGGNAERALEKALASGELISSAFIFQELTRVLTEKFAVPDGLVSNILDTVSQVAIVIVPHTSLPTICRDPDDNNILQLAESADAAFIVTGDKDLLMLDSFQGIPIITPATFLQLT